MAPASVLSMFVAPAAGRLTDKIGGKYILMLGLTLFAGGMGWVALEATTTSVWYDFMPALIVAGLGMGCVFAPMVTVAMRNIDPRMAGAASGVLNTIRQVGLVIGTAAVGALLQNRLIAAWTSQATSRSRGLPGPVRSQLVAGFRDAAKSGLQVGSGQNGGVHLPPHTPAPLAHQVTLIGQQVFSTGFVQGMRWTVVMPVGMMLLAALSCLAIRGGKPSATPAAAADNATATAGTSSAAG
jgi:MFS family permease